VALVDVIETRPEGSTDLMIRLLRPDTSEVGNRRVSIAGTCEDKAEAVATILAAWETDPKSESAAADEPAPAAKGEPSVVVTPARTSGWNVLVGAGAGAAFIGGVAASGTIEAVAGRSDSHWQMRAGATGQTARSLMLATGQADWQHTSFALGLLWRTLGYWQASIDVGPVLGWGTIAGTGFSSNRQQRIFEYGGAAGLRLGHTWGRWTLWAEARTNLWLQDEQATAKDPVSGQVVARASVPTFDATAGLGLSLALFP